MGDENTFGISVKKPDEFGGKYTVTVSSGKSYPAYGVVTMIARDENGNIFKKNRVAFTAGSYETRQIDFLLGVKAGAVEFVVYDNAYSCRALSDSIEFTK